MYWDQELKHHDAAEFVKAAVDEISTHQENGQWKVVPLDDIPKETPVLDAVWSMKMKQKLMTNEVYKHKARLNVHGGQQGVSYWETYAPVVTWAPIRIVLVLVLIYSSRCRVRHLHEDTPRFRNRRENVTFARLEVNREPVRTEAGW
jgi:hypothetical protein